MYRSISSILLCPACDRTQCLSTERRNVIELLQVAVGGAGGKQASTVTYFHLAQMRPSDPDYIPVSGCIRSITSETTL